MHSEVTAMRLQRTYRFTVDVEDHTLTEDSKMELMPLRVEDLDGSHSARAEQCIKSEWRGRCRVTKTSEPLIGEIAKARDEICEISKKMSSLFFGLLYSAYLRLESHNLTRNPLHPTVVNRTVYTVH